MVLRAERASARLALLPLFQREVRVPSLHATGVDAEIARVEEAIPSPPRGDRGWTLRFDGIHSETIRSVRVGKLLIVGQGSGTVGFVKQLRGGPSELLDSEVAFADADVSLDGTQLLGDMGAAPRPGVLTRWDQPNFTAWSKAVEAALREFESGPLQKDGGFDFVDRNRDGAVTSEELGTAAAYLRRAEYGVFALGDPGDQTGDLTGTHVQWRHQKGVAKVTSPVLLDGRLVVVQDGGMVTSTEADTGRIVFERERLGADGGGDYFASPITDGMQVCFCSLRGVVTIAGAGEAFSVLRQVKLGETISATPALVGPRLYVRSTGSLWLFSE